MKFGPTTLVTQTPLVTILSQDSGDNLTMNQGLGGKLSVPLPQVAAHQQHTVDWTGL